MADNYTLCDIDMDIDEQKYGIIRFAIMSFEGICISIGAILMLFTILQFLFFDKLNTVFIIIQSQVSLNNFFFVKLSM